MFPKSNQRRRAQAAMREEWETGEEAESGVAGEQQSRPEGEEAEEAE